ncbi:unnamed protein product [Didymodactylos carnosus]|uniref:PLAT domain-containing protein n=1 Tax=Didymodactylos carnosus TaxID=1234261 RepID=A0A8S2VXH3_9BILA|nr:unnamed protein product [Didymodactylos carnosus]CAF4423039.1 unnamed protein product [Didymodactylos carnosus]
MVIETACYSFTNLTGREYYNSLKNDICQLHNVDNQDVTLPSNGPYLECYCSSFMNYFLLTDLKQLDIQFELSEQVWHYFLLYVIILVTIYLLLSIYAIRADVHEHYRPLVKFINDNQMPTVSRYLFQLTIFTGLQRAASSNLKIFVRIMGKKQNDSPHCLNTDNNEAFQRGSCNQFLLTSFVDLGIKSLILLFIEIFHMILCYFR